MQTEPIKIARTTCGKTIKVFHQVDDWQTFCIGARFPELWTTIHKERSAMDAINHCLSVNQLEIAEVIK